MTDVRAEIIALIERARSEGSKVVAIEALDRVLHGFPDDAEFTAFLRGLVDVPPPRRQS